MCKSVLEHLKFKYCYISHWVYAMTKVVSFGLLHIVFYLPMIWSCSSYRKHYRQIIFYSSTFFKFYTGFCWSYLRILECHHRSILVAWADRFSWTEVAVLLAVAIIKSSFMSLYNWPTFGFMAKLLEVCASQIGILGVIIL